MRIANPLPACSRLPLRQTGAGLIEVLVSIVIMSFGLLGLAGMYNYALSSNKSASSRMAAAMLVTDFAEIVRANPDGFTNNLYNHDLGSYDPNSAVVSPVSSSDLCAYPACTVATLATQDVALMNARVRAYLPAGAFHVQRVAGAGNQMDIWVMWVEGKGGGGANDKETSIDNCPRKLVTQNPRPDPFPRCLYNRVGI